MPLKFVSGGSSSRPPPVAAVYTLRHNSASVSLHKSELKAAVPRNGSSLSRAHLTSVLSAPSLLSESAAGVAPLRASCAPFDCDFSPRLSSASPLESPRPRCAKLSFFVCLPLPRTALPLRPPHSRSRSARAIVFAQRQLRDFSAPWAELSAAAASWAAKNSRGAPQHHTETAKTEEKVETTETVEGAETEETVEGAVSVERAEKAEKTRRASWAAALHWLFSPRAAEESRATINFHAAARPLRDPLRAWRRRTSLPPPARAPERIAEIFISDNCQTVALAAAGCCRAERAAPLRSALAPAARLAPADLFFAPPPPARDFLTFVFSAAPPRNVRSRAKCRMAHFVSRQKCAALPATAELRMPRGARTHLTLALRNAAAAKLSALLPPPRRRPFRSARVFLFCRRPAAPLSFPPLSFASAADIFSRGFLSACGRPSRGHFAVPAAPVAVPAAIRWAAPSARPPLAGEKKTKEKRESAEEKRESAERAEVTRDSVFPRDAELRSFAAFRRRSGEGVRAVFRDDVETMPRGVRDETGAVEDAQLHYGYRLAFEQAKEKLGIQ